MKRNSIVYLLSLLTLTLLAAACTGKVEKTPLYKHYAGRADLTVAEVKGFHLGDGVKVDVVILVADDTAAWNNLKREFDIRTVDGVTSWMGSVDDPGQHVRGSSLPAWRAMAVHKDRTIAFYLLESETQYEALLDYQMDNLVK